MYLQFSVSFSLKEKLFISLENAKSSLAWISYVVWLEIFGQCVFMVYRLKLIVVTMHANYRTKAFLYRLQIWMMNLLTWF